MIQKVKGLMGLFLASLVLVACSGDKDKVLENTWQFEDAKFSVPAEFTFWGTQELNVLDVVGDSFTLSVKHVANFDGAIIEDEIIASGKVDYGKKELTVEESSPAFTEYFPGEPSTVMIYRIEGDEDYRGEEGEQSVTLYFDKDKKAGRTNLVLLSEAENETEASSSQEEEIPAPVFPTMTDDVEEEEEEQTRSSQEPTKEEQHSLSIAKVPAIDSEGKMHIDISGDFVGNELIELTLLVRNKATGAEGDTKTFATLDPLEKKPLREELFASLPDGEYESILTGETIVDGVRHIYTGKVDSVIKDGKFLPETFTN